jgi:hypothetical protein
VRLVLSLVLGLGRCDFETLLRGVVEKGNGGSSAQRDENIVIIAKGVVIGSKFGWMLDGSTLVITSTVGVTSKSELVSLWIGI